MGHTGIARLCLTRYRHRTRTDCSLFKRKEAHTSIGGGGGCHTQGDYGLFQCSTPCHEQTYDNETIIQKMVEAQGYTITEDKELVLPEGTMPKMSVPSSLVPHCPRCGKWMSMNLRADRTFVEDEGWNEAAQRYDAFLKQHRNSRIVFIELGVGMNTPGIIKYPFWRMTAQNPGSFYTCVNAGEAFCPEEIAGRSLCLNKDINEVLKQMKEQYERKNKESEIIESGYIEESESVFHLS